ncbi:MAG: PD-(D/E)XK nuclease domain-containing protein, partial [candidate division NC10 bacterium]
AGNQSDGKSLVHMLEEMDKLVPAVPGPRPSSMVLLDGGIATKANLALLREKHYNLPTLEGLEVSQAVFSTFELERLSPEALLFQTGYLTIQDIQDNVYTLNYPNQEVKTAFTESLLLATEGLAPEVSSHVLKLSRHLADGNLEAFFEAMTAIFAAIPYDIQTKRDEGYYHTLFYLAISASGGQAQSSLLTCHGRIDLTVTFPDKVYVIEFKCNHNAAVAVAQIRERGYAAPYRQSGSQGIPRGESVRVGVAIRRGGYGGE